MTRFAQRGLIFVFGLFATASVAQKSSGLEWTRNEGTVANSLIWDAVSGHKANDPNFRIVRQEPVLPNDSPPLLVHKNGKISLDWTPEQNVRYLMESIRQGIHILRAAPKSDGIDAMAIHAGTEIWPKLRDIACKDEPGLKYWDLDGVPSFCPE